MCVAVPLFGRESVRYVCMHVWLFVYVCAWPRLLSTFSWLTCRQTGQLHRELCLLAFSAALCMCVYLRPCLFSTKRMFVSCWTCSPCMWLCCWWQICSCCFVCSCICTIKCKMCETQSVCVFLLALGPISNTMPISNTTLLKKKRKCALL